MLAKGVLKEAELKCWQKVFLRSGTDVFVKGVLKGAEPKCP